MVHCQYACDLATDHIRSPEEEYGRYEHRTEEQDGVLPNESMSVRCRCYQLVAWKSEEVERGRKLDQDMEEEGEVELRDLHFLSS